MATLVTGGAGFVGSNIVKGLAEAGHRVVCFDLTPADALLRDYLKPWAQNVTFVQGDILNVKDLEQAAAFQAIDKVVHAAVFTPAQRGSMETERSRDIVNINIEGTVNLLDLAAACNLKRFLYVSSEAVYGDPPAGMALVHEDAPLRPRNLYAISKHTSEQLTRRYGDLHGFQTASVRLSYPYGPMERVTGHRSRMSLIYRWTGNVVRKEPIVVEDRTIGRDYTFTGDVASGIRAVLDAPTLPHDVYNLSAGRPITLEEVINALVELRPSLEVIDLLSEERPEAPERPAEESQAVRDASRIRADLGFSPSHDMTAGLKACLEWREGSGFMD
jgi:nucleoside-diphosphate-sugar epimerase